MQKIKQLWQKTDRVAVLVAVGVGFVFTWLVSFLSVMTLIPVFGSLLLVVYGGLAIWLGLRLRERWWPMLFWFPLAFLLAAYLVFPKYLWLFALVYLGLSYLAWSMSKQG